MQSESENPTHVKLSMKLDGKGEEKWKCWKRQILNFKNKNNSLYGLVAINLNIWQANFDYNGSNLLSMRDSEFCSYNCYLFASIFQNNTIHRNV